MRGQRKEFETALVIVRANGINGEGVSERGRQGLRDVGTVSYFVSPPSQLRMSAFTLSCLLCQKTQSQNQLLEQGVKAGPVR